ncbi:MAG: flagellar biosynthesis protein FlhA, partial [candidate division Zixibacteria bacterium]|nr:flagellar biosynthesis protein FlhA [candidate division Zixibacteria bacterium]
AVLVIPIPTALLDFALAFNITFSLVVLLTTLYVTKPLELSVFPGMLLVVTLMRLSLNVASTRLILGQAYAGEVINSFGNFVVQGDYVVGFIVFIILVIIQFVVITKGAGRISEVAARFTLDAMPGKQMAIDADLNAGIIGDQDARDRREAISHEADFYGAMDGASKFVRGDAIASILITLINIIGGFVIGIAMKDMSLAESMRTYSLLSIGDGLVTQIPALLVSTASGIIVTRAAATSNMGSDLATQLTKQPRAILVTAIVLILFGMMPGMPTATFVILGLIAGGVGFAARAAIKSQAREADQLKQQEKASAQVTEERTEDLLKVDILGLEIGYGLIPLVDANQGGDLLSRIGMIRKQLATELGIIVPPVRIRDNVQLGPNQYSLKVKGIKTASYELMPDHLLAINPGYVEDKLDGFETVDPAFGLKATWIIPGLKETAELKGFTIVEPSAVIATHLTEVVRSSAPEILSRQDVQHLTQTLKDDYPALVDGVIPEVVPLGTLQKILQSLLAERIPVRDLATIIETTSDYIGATKEPEVLAEYVRISLRRQITDLYRDKSGKIYVFTVDPAIEQQMAESIQSSKQGLVLGLEPSLAEKLLAEIGKLIEKMSNSGQIQLCICSPNIRLVLRKLAESKYPALNVVSYNEILPETELISIGIVRIENES